MTDPSNRFWDAAYRLNIGKMIGVCYRYTADRQLAEDLAHDAFLKAIDKSGSFTGRGSFDAWLRRIVVNHTIQYLRDQKREKTYQKEVLTVPAISEAGLPGENSPESTDFSETELLVAIDQLPKHHRLVFNLYVMDQFTHIQIGEELGISPGTSKSHLARARKKLKQLLVERTESKQPEKSRKKLFPFFFFPGLNGNIDRLYQQRLGKLELPDTQVKPLEALNRGQALPAVKSGVSFAHYAALILSAGIVSWVIYVLSVLPSEEPDRVTTSASVPVMEKVVPLIENSTNRQAIENSRRSMISDPDTATISADSVILNETKQKVRMKTLDTVMTLALVSSMIPFDSVAQDQEVNSTRTTKVQMITGNVSVPAEKGTILASKLFWSNEDQEIYLKGRVTVWFGENNFVGDGSFNFLGPVHLLIFNEEPITPGTTVKLSNQPYRVIRLNSQEATQKYGDKGQQGAVEISLMQ